MHRQRSSSGRAGGRFTLCRRGGRMLDARQGGGGGGDGITATTFFLSSPSHSLSRSNSSSPLSPILPSSPSRSIDERIDRTPASIAMSVANRSLRTLRIQNPQRLAALAGAAARPSASFGAARCSASPSLSSSTRTFSSSVAKQSGAPAMASSAREYDPEIKDIADYVANKPIDSELAVSCALSPPQSRAPRCPAGSSPRLRSTHTSPTECPG